MWPTQLHNAAMDDLPPLPANLDWELPTSHNLEVLRKRTESSKAGNDSEHRSLHAVRFQLSRPLCRPRACLWLTIARRPCNGRATRRRPSSGRRATMAALITAAGSPTVATTVA